MFHFANSFNFNNSMFSCISVHAGIRVCKSTRLPLLKSQPWNDCDTNSEDYLAFAAANPLSLQQLVRVEIRKKLIKKMANFKQNDINYNKLKQFGSILKHYILQLGLPVRLQNYLYDFPDVPLMQPDTIYMQNGIPFGLVGIRLNSDAIN